MEEDGDNYSQMQELGTHHQPLQAGAQADQVDLDVVYKPAAQAAPLKSHDLAQTWWLVTRRCHERPAPLGASRPHVDDVGAGGVGPGDGGGWPNRLYHGARDDPVQGNPSL